MAGKNKVMVIDDDAAILDAVELLLTDAGYEVKTCTNGDCWLKEKSFKPDLVLLDLLLSGHDGRTIVAQARKSSDSKTVPIIIMSAHTLKAEDALVSGAQEFLPKPFDIDVLLALVKKYLA